MTAQWKTEKYEKEALVRNICCSGGLARSGVLYKANDPFTGTLKDSQLEGAHKQPF
ncbi:UNVERIFIED_CONTAM: hypothetical protein Sradi_7311800 [Sesamum radiatum]|uniref:Uncharacterized protein n=1 Tax=Sesamum radiatum TaxID=300843 RepID=A0AAW2I6D6_SESRA